MELMFSLCTVYICHHVGGCVVVDLYCGHLQFGCNELRTVIAGCDSRTMSEMVACLVSVVVSVV